MNEKNFQALLIKLGIATNRSYAEVYEALDSKLCEYLDRQDDASQDMVADIQEALEYVEKKKEEVGRGIAIVTEEKPQSSDKVDFNELRSASQKNVANQARATQAGSSVSSGAATPASLEGTGNSGKLWFYSLTGAANIDTMFYQACDDLKYDQFEHAGSIFEMILQVEPNNASAYLGKALVAHKLKEPREIGSATDKPLDKDINLLRAKDHGTDVQKKYISDALQERDNCIKYRQAEMYAKATKDRLSNLKQAEEIFTKLGGYRDAKTRAEACREDIYIEAEAKMKDANSASEYEKLREIFSKLKGYKNADVYCEICENRRDELRVQENQKRIISKLEKEYKRLEAEFDTSVKNQEKNYANGWETSISDGEKVLNEKLDALIKFIQETPALTLYKDRETLIEDAKAQLDKVKQAENDYKRSNQKTSIKKIFWLVILWFVVVGISFLMGLSGRI